MTNTVNNAPQGLFHPDNFDTFPTFRIRRGRKQRKQWCKHANRFPGC